MKMEQILMSESTNNSDDLYSVVYGNSKIISFLLAEDLSVDDIHPAALASYYVDYYFSQVNTAGFSKFVHHSQWSSDINARIAYGLKEMRAFKHYEFFSQKQKEINEISKEELDKFFQSPYHVDMELRKDMDEDKTFYWIDDEIVDLNGTWLREHKDKKVLSMEDIFLELEEVLGKPITR